MFQSVINKAMLFPLFKKENLCYYKTQLITKSEIRILLVRHH